MKTLSRRLRWLLVGLGFCAAAAPSGSARAETVIIEAEGVSPVGVNGPFGYSVTSPLFVRDSPAASSGSYLDIQSGTNNLTTPPANGEGIAKYDFQVTSAGTYRIWARVIAPSTMGDSFWIRLNELRYDPSGIPRVVPGTWIKWNGIPVGTSWHWAPVKTEAATAPMDFALVPGDDPNSSNPVHLGYQLEVGAREDGARVDVFKVTSDAAFAPAALVASLPAVVMQEPVVGTGQFWLTWQTVPGATSYTLERRDDAAESPTWQVLKASLTGHSYIDNLPLGNGSYRVRAVAGTVIGEARDGGPYVMSPILHEPMENLIFTGSDTMSVTRPMTGGNGSPVVTPAGVTSTSAPPAHGRARLDFRVGQQTKTKIWADVSGLNGAGTTGTSDSFWVRMDSGAWIKWNGIKAGCADVRNADAGNKVVFFDLAPGSHRLEFAYREAGVMLNDRIVITPNLGLTPQCSD